MDNINAVSPLDGRYGTQTLSISQCTSEYALIRYRVQIEVRWFMHIRSYLPNISTLSSDEKNWLLEVIDNFNTNDAQDIKSIEQSINHDVKAIEYWLKEKLRTHTSLAKHQELIHFTCTSEDINNIAYALMQKNIRKIVLQHMDELTNKLTGLAQCYAHLPMLSRTHGQAASPTTLGKEIGNFIYRLNRQRKQFEHIDITAKINGAVGNYNAHYVTCPDVDWLEVSKTFIESFGLQWNPMTTQIEPHDSLAEFFHNSLRYNTILLDMCRDIWSYISIGYFRQQSVDGEVGSSTMPHKVNPIQFENGEGNLGIANALLEHLAHKLPVSRWQRDLTDSTVLRNLGSAYGYCCIAYTSISKGLDKLEANEALLAEDLENNYEVLAEAIQTIMRFHNLDNPYEQLKSLTRGKQINKTSLQAFINQLQLPQNVKAELSEISPASFVGIAPQLLQTFVLDKT